MPALKSLRLAIQVATSRRDDVGKVVAQAYRHASSARDQLAQLESYAADTEVKWAVSSRVCTTPEIVRHYYDFMNRLHKAIGLQEHVVGDLERQVAAAQQVLLEAELRIASLNQVLQRNTLAQMRLEAGREQKLNDEFAALQYRRMLAARDTLGAP